MAIENISDLKRFLNPFPPEVQETAFWLRSFVWKLYPQTNELIYDNYNAVAFGWSPTDRAGHVFCTMSVQRSNYNLHFGFYWGSEIADPEKMLLGAGKQYRYILVKSEKDFPKAYMKKLLKEAYTNSLAKVKDPKQLMQGATLVKAISKSQRAAAKSKQLK